MNNFERIKTKIMSIDEVKKCVSSWKTRHNKIVFSNGCFDILHLGHIDYLSKASSLGDFLVIGLNSDKSVNKIKGTNRPINDEVSRAHVLASLFFVDAVVLFDEDTPQELIDIVKPNVLIKGSDYKPQEVVGYTTVTQNGGQVITLDFIEGYSTSLIEKKILNVNKIND